MFALGLFVVVPRVPMPRLVLAVRELARVAVAAGGATSRRKLCFRLAPPDKSSRGVCFPKEVVA